MLAEQAPRWKINLLEEGFARGKQEGLIEGEEKGIKRGMERGMEKGMERGMEKGMERGMEKGMEKGILIGIKNSLQEVLTSRFGLLSKELLASIDKITNVNTLKDMLVEATSTESLNKFIEKMRNKYN